MIWSDSISLGIAQIRCIRHSDLVEWWCLLLIDQGLAHFLNHIETYTRALRAIRWVRWYPLDRAELPKEGLQHASNLVIINKWLELIDQLDEIAFVFVDYSLDGGPAVFVSENEETEEHEELLFDLLLGLVVHCWYLLHYILEVVLVIDEVLWKFIVVDVYIIFLKANFWLSIGVLLRVVQHALSESRLKNLVLNLHTVPL